MPAWTQAISGAPLQPLFEELDPADQIADALIDLVICHRKDWKQRKEGATTYDKSKEGAIGPKPIEKNVFMAYAANSWGIRH